MDCNKAYTDRKENCSDEIAMVYAGGYGGRSEVKRSRGQIRECVEEAREVT